MVQSYRLVHRFILLLLLLAWPAAAEEFNRLTDIDHRTNNGVVEITLRTEKRPDAQVYVMRKLDRLVVDLVDTLPEEKIRLGAPPTKAVAKWELDKADMTRTRLVLTLRHRLPPEGLETEIGNDRVVVKFRPYFRRSEEFQLTEGVTWKQSEEALFSGYLLWNELSFDPRDPKVKVDVGLAKDRLDSREPVSQMVKRTRTLAGINGGFFASSGGPLGVVVRDTKLLAPHVGRRPPRTVLAIKLSGEVFFERLKAKGLELLDLQGGLLSGMRMALGGGPQLLRDGRLSLTTDAEQLGPRGNDITRVAARTAVALTKDRKMLWVTATGYRDNHREGLQLGPLARRLLKIGAVDAMNFDGGASVDMVVGGHIVSDGPGNVTKEKPVATALLLEDRRDASYPANIKIEPDSKRLTADGESSSRVEITVSDPQGRAVADGTFVRVYGYQLGVSEGGLKTQGGKVSLKVDSRKRVGDAALRVECGPVSEEQSFFLVAGPPARMFNLLGKGRRVEGDRQKRDLTVQVNDRYGNGVPGVKVTFNGEQTFTTNRNGQVEAVMEVAAGGDQINLNVPGLDPGKVEVPAVPKEDTAEKSD